MTNQTIISTPYPTLEETARKMGVPLRRAHELDQLVGGRSRSVSAYAAKRTPKKAGAKKGNNLLAKSD